ncbi:MAG: nucleotide exchange factor GrpE [Bacteroidetes bacterium]|nr:nucleotide exchange factor GrpE [Bacteroidota bacterium]
MDNTEEENEGKVPEMSETEKESEQPKESEEPLSASGTESEIVADLDKLQKQLGESEALISSYKDQLLRLAAEFENFRKRVEVERADFVKFSNEKVIRDILPILDDFNRALTNGKANHDFDSFYKGIEMIYQKFYKQLEDKGLKPIDSIGKVFDVTYHDVLMQVQRPEVEPHTIVEEIERGYMLHGKVIKHAKVIVAAEGNDQSNSTKKN